MCTQYVQYIGCSRMLSWCWQGRWNNNLGFVICSLIFTGCLILSPLLQAAMLYLAGLAMYLVNMADWCYPLCCRLPCCTWLGWPCTSWDSSSGTLVSHHPGSSTNSLTISFISSGPFLSYSFNKKKSFCSDTLALFSNIFAIPFSFPQEYWLINCYFLGYWLLASNFSYINQ